MARASSRCFLDETAVIRRGHDLAALGDVALQQLHVLVVDPRARWRRRTGRTCGGGKTVVVPWLLPQFSSSRRGRRGPRSRSRSPRSRSPRSPRSSRWLRAWSTAEGPSSWAVDLDGQDAHDVLMEPHQPLHLLHRRGRGVGAHVGVVALAVLVDLVGHGLQAPVLGADDRPPLSLRTWPKCSISPSACALERS